MDQNIIYHPTGTIIMNGGNPLEGCPESYEEADKWAENTNESSVVGPDGPKWKFDCGFKLDYDGPLVGISSRFYPPKTHYGPTWDGTVTIYYLGQDVFEKQFDCKSLDELRAQVENFVKTEALIHFIKWYNENKTK